MTAPVQVLVVGFEHPTFSGEVLAELARLREQGVVRLVDLLVVSRAEDGSFDTVPVPTDSVPAAGAVATALLGEAPGGRRSSGESDAGGDAVTWSLADVVPPGTTAAVALIEHLWAQPLTAAIRRAGGTALDETWLGPDDVASLGQLTAAGRAAPVPPQPAGSSPTG